MSAILPHMVWPQCEFKMQVWNLLHAAHWKHRTQKSRQKSLSGHHRTTLSGYIFIATKTRIDNRKKLVKQQYALNMSPQYGELRPTGGWDRLTSLGHPCKFQLVSRLGSITARHLVVGVCQTLRRWTEGATYIRQGDHHAGHWPTFLVLFVYQLFLYASVAITAVTELISFCDRELWPITLTFVFVLDRVTVNQYAKYLGKKACYWYCPDTHSLGWASHCQWVTRAYDWWLRSSKILQTGSGILRCGQPNAMARFFESPGTHL